MMRLSFWSDEVGFWRDLVGMGLFWVDDMFFLLRKDNYIYNCLILALSCSSFNSVEFILLFRAYTYLASF